jgi:tRNA(Ile)-lysidine synthase
MLTVPGAWRERLASVQLTQRAVLAISGGADSMLLAEALLASSPEMIAAVATFDHGTGAFASEACATVGRWATARGLPLRAGRATAIRRSEAAWRTARWAFLRTVSAEFGAPVATAHSEDDQVETVFIRLLRGSGVRGLAGLLAPGPVLRPLLSWSRSEARACAAACDIDYLDDPSNLDLRFLRNRVRRELLPALERAEPGFRQWLLALGQSAAAWRADVSAGVDQWWAPELASSAECVHVRRDRRRPAEAPEAALFWPEVAARVGVTLDRRGTARLASFTTQGGAGREMPLSGGARVYQSRSGWTLCQSANASADAHQPIGGHHAGGV